MAKAIPAIVDTIDVPLTLERALDKAWLQAALAPMSGGAEITSVDVVETIRTVATKVRFAVRFKGADQAHAFCLKGLLDADESMAGGGASTLLEVDYYKSVAPALTVRSPTCVSAVVDAKQAVFIMRDLIVTENARFCSALEALTPDQAAQSLEQIARLHAGRSLMSSVPSIKRLIAFLASIPFVTPEMLQGLLDGPRGEGLPPSTRNGGRLLQGMKALEVFDGALPQTLVHGDCHAGNLYWTPEGPGLIDFQVLQSANWAVDVSYHINALLDVATAEREERNLLHHYLEAARGLGVDVPDRDTAWKQYRASAIYGYYMWAITRRVDPAIINVFTNRLGSAVTRHESHHLLGV
jgi:hypothetical protein